MIKVTKMDGSEMYLNCELMESIIESPDTRITLSNGNCYIVLEPARVLLRRIVNFKASVMRYPALKVRKRVNGCVHKGTDCQSEGKLFFT